MEALSVLSFFLVFLNGNLDAVTGLGQRLSASVIPGDALSAKDRQSQSDQTHVDDGIRVADDQWELSGKQRIAQIPHHIIQRLGA